MQKLKFFGFHIGRIRDDQIVLLVLQLSGQIVVGFHGVIEDLEALMEPEQFGILPGQLCCRLAALNGRRVYLGQSVQHGQRHGSRAAADFEHIHMLELAMVFNDQADKLLRFWAWYEDSGCRLQCYVHKVPFADYVLQRHASATRIEEALKIR